MVKNGAIWSFWMRQSIILFILMVLTGCYALHIGQDSNWDLRNYHWYNAYSLIHQRFDIDIAAAGKSTYNNPLLDLVNYFIIQFYQKSRSAEFALGTLHGIALYFLLNIALIVFQSSPYKWLYAIIATFVGATGVASLYQVGSTYNDSEASIFIMASLFVFLKAIESKKRSQFFLAAFILSIGIVAKLTMIFFGIGIFASLLCYKKWDFAHFQLIMITGLAFLTGFFLFDGWWMWKVYCHFQNPLFPYYNAIFKSSYAVKTNMVDNAWVPKKLSQAILYPFYWLKKNTLTQEFPMKDPRFLVTFLLGLLLIAKQLYHKWMAPKPSIPIASPQIRFLFLFFCFSFIVWMAQFSIYRYTIPLNFLTGILIVYCCQHLITLQKAQLLLIILISSAVIHFTKVNFWNRIPFAKLFFTIELPPALPQNALILIDGESPLSYLISFFPPSNRFVGYFNRIVVPYNPGLYQLVIKTIHEFKKPRYVLFIQSDKELANQHLLLNNLKINEPCQIIKSNLEYFPIEFCAIENV